MRLFLTLSILAVSSLTLAACHVHGNGPPHCPPGHAKKGWCSPHHHH